MKRVVASLLSAEANYCHRLSLSKKHCIPRYVSTLRGVIRLTPSIPPLTYVPSQRIRSLSTAASKPASNEVDFLLADIGEGIAECELLRWMVKPGDRIAQFDPVCEVQSDKANVEITSRYDGVIKTLHSKQGDMVKVGRPLLTIIVDNDPSSSSSSSTPSPPESPTIPASSASSLSSPDPATLALKNEKILCSPAVRRMAREHNLDLSIIPTTGKHGHLTKDDVINFLEGKTAPVSTSPPKDTTPPPSSPPPTTPSSSKVSTSKATTTTTTTTPSTPTAPKVPSAKPTTTPPTTPIKPLQVLESDKIVPISGLQRIMVQTMTASNAVPQFGYSDEFYMDELVKVRSQVKSIAEKQGVRLSYLAFIIKATSLALTQYPQLNAWVKDADCTEIIYKASHNIGLAMDTPRGLLVPNIKNVQDKSVLDIGRELNRLADLGQQGKLGKDDLSGGTFTISNIGSIGGTYTKPIILLPEVMIGGLGKFQTLPRYDSKGHLYPATLMAVTWSADHRVLDGATVARFSNLLKQYVENPSSIIIATK